MKKKLLEMMSYRSMTPQQLSIASGLSYDTVKNLIYGRVSDPKLSTLLPICDALNCSLDYITGRGGATCQQLRDFPSHSTKFLEHISDIEYELSCKSAVDNHAYRAIIIPNKFASNHMIVDGYNIGYITVDNLLAQFPDEIITCGIFIQGNELAPIYFDGDILLINGNRHPHVEEIGLYFGENHDIFIRRYRYSEDEGGMLVPLQPHQSVLFMKSHHSQCMGTVIGVFRGDVKFPNPSYQHTTTPTPLAVASPV